MNTIKTEFNLQYQLLEKTYIEQALEMTNGVVSNASKILGISRTELVQNISNYKINVDDFYRPNN